MQPLTQEITDLQAKISQNEAKINTQLVELGKQIVKAGIKTLKDTPLGDLYTEITALREIKPRKKKEIQTIESIEISLNQLSTQIKEKLKQIAESKKASRLHYGNIGETAYNTYKKDPAGNATYQELFFDLIALDEKLQRADKSRQELDSAEERGKQGNIVSQIFTITKSLFYEKKKDFFVSRQAALFKQVGQKAIASDFMAHNDDDTALQESVAPINALLETIRHMEEELEHLRQTEQNQIDDLAALGAKSSTTRRIKELEQEIEQTQQLINTKSGELGKLYVDKSEAIKLELPEIATLLAALRQLNKENSGYRDQTARLHARIEISKLRYKISRNEASAENLKTRMAKDKEEIKNLSRSNTELEAEITRLATEYKIDPASELSE